MMDLRALLKEILLLAVTCNCKQCMSFTMLPFCSSSLEHEYMYYQCHVHVQCTLDAIVCSVHAVHSVHTHCALNWDGIVEKVNTMLHNTHTCG